MKKIILLFALVVMLVSCEKNVIGDDLENAPASTVVNPINKKGSCYTLVSKNWSYKTHDVGAHWMYNWGIRTNAKIPDNVEFVPMFWGRSSVTDANIAYLKQQKAERKLKYVLGFNEPDGAEQANMTVAEAIALWPKLEEIGVPLGSPAAVNPTGPWMKEFMAKAEELGLRIDFIAVHGYPGSNPFSIIDMVKKTYAAYKRPIWITEFAVAHWAATTPANNIYSEASVKTFMEQVLPMLDQIDYVHRYAWFDGRQAQLITSSLFDDNGVITSVGQTYAAHVPNTTIGPGQDTNFVSIPSPGELLTNGDFEAGVLTPWGGYNNTVVSDFGGQGFTYFGNFAGRINVGPPGNTGGTLFIDAPVVAGKTYVLKYWSRWINPVTTSFAPTLRNALVAGTPGLLATLAPVPLANVWTETVVEYTVPTGVTQLRIQFFRASGPAFYLDDVSLKLK